jgi:hypothetical protein
MAEQCTHTNGHKHPHQCDTVDLDQVCTVIVCLAIGGVAIGLNLKNQLVYILAEWLHPWLLGAGICLVAVAMCQGINLLFRRFSSNAAHHDPHSCHSHEHDWAPWRYTVLLIPVVLFLLDLPNQGFSLARADTEIAEGMDVEARGGNVIGDYLELHNAAYTEQSRNQYVGRTANIIAQVAPGSNRVRFTIARYKMRCCPGDAIPIQMFVEVEDSADLKKTFSSQALHQKWIEITGIVQFRQRLGDQEFVTLLKTTPKNIKIVSPPANPYVQ